MARDELAHELMYFSRGNPVVYYGDEQGFTGPGGDQDARQTLFASKVPDYLDDDLLGTDATHATDNFNTGHPLYAKISELAQLTKEHPALRDGAHQHRYASDGPGIYAFSRTDAKDQREYVVALNNSEEPQTAAVPTYIAKRNYSLIYGDAADELQDLADGKLTVTVPPLSAVVYKSAGRIPRSKAAPAVALQAPAAAAATATSAGDNGRIQVTADVDGTSFYEVTFQARTAGGDWEPSAPMTPRPTGSSTTSSGLQPRHAVEVPGRRPGQRGPHVGQQLPHRHRARPGADHPAAGKEGSTVQGNVEVVATADPEKASHVVRFERSVAGGPWTAIGSGR